MLYLINHGYSNIQGFDFSMHAIQCAKNTNLEVEELDLLDFTEGRLNKKFDVIISNDTFNYLNYPYEQKLVLNNFYSNLNKNGIVIMNLAALDVFKGIHDIAVGLKMRFTVDMVTELVDSRKFLIKKLRFWPFMLSPLIYIIRRNQNSRIIKGKYSIISDNHIPSPPVNYLLYLLTRLELSLFNNYPFGSSLLVILKKYR